MDEEKKYSKEELIILNTPCTPGDTKCMIGNIHVCGSDGKWVWNGKHC